MDELLHELKKFLDSDERGYLLSRDEAALLLHEIERYRPVPFLSFNDIKQQAKRGHG